MLKIQTVRNTTWFKLMYEALDMSSCLKCLQAKEAPSQFYHSYRQTKCIANIVKKCDSAI